MGGRVVRDDLFNSRKTSERMGGKATKQLSLFLYLATSTERENLQTRWVLMASWVSKFDSKKAVPGAQDTTRLRKFFRTDSRGKLQLELARTLRIPRSWSSLNFSRFISWRLMLSPKKGKIYSLELLAVNSRLDLRSREKSFLRSTDANSIDSTTHRYLRKFIIFKVIISLFRKFVNGVKQKILSRQSNMFK